MQLNGIRNRHRLKPITIWNNQNKKQNQSNSNQSQQNKYLQDNHHKLLGLNKANSFQGFGGYDLENKINNLVSRIAQEGLNYSLLSEIMGQVVSERQIQLVQTDIVRIVQKFLGRLYAKIIAYTLQKLMQKTMLRQQAKIYICSECLISALKVIKLYQQNIQKNSISLINPFIMMNEINKEILNFLKSKYPRNKNLFVSHELLSKFKEVNFSTLMQNNILKNSGFSFTQSDLNRKEILSKTKHFINCIIDEANNNFYSFSQLLTDEAFKLKDGLDLKQNKIKIGRKIPQNTQKYYQFQSDNMDITSPQVFRVMIKWIQEMQNLLNNPSDIISARHSIRYIKIINQDNIILSEIRSNRFTEIKTEIIQKISQENIYKEEFKSLIQKLNQFNNNLTNTLHARVTTANFIPEQQVQILKFSKFNTEFLQWLIVEKYLIIINTLNQMSQYFEKKIFKKIDFINFNVYDLMRASFTGEKYHILQVFDNLKILEEKDKIKIVRVKNRMNTPLNDVLINFKMKQSFIICELQLILIDSSYKDGEQKLKIMQDLNHTIYQLERSPYGSLSQMAVIIGYTDPSINYQNRIHFKKDWFKQGVCINGTSHQFQEINHQTTPFVCSWCVKFYGRLENFFQYYKCSFCNLQKCKVCMFEQNQQQQIRVYSKYFASRLLNITLQKIENDDDDFLDNLFMQNKGPAQFIDPPYYRVRDEIIMKGKMKLSQLQKFLYRMQIDYNLKGNEAFYCLLLHFSNGQYSLHVLKYVNYRVSVCTLNNISKDIKIKLQQHDIIYVFNKKLYLNSSNKKSIYLIKKQFENSLSSNFIDIRNGKSITINQNKYAAVFIHFYGKKYILEIQKIGYDKQIDTELKINKKINNILQECQQYNLSRESINLSRIGLNQNYLRQFLQRNWKIEIKVLNLGHNMIENADQILNSLTQLQQLYLNKNQITIINIITDAQLILLDLQYNSLILIPDSINKLKKLQILNLSNNNIKEINILYLIELQDLNLSNNYINNFNSLIQSKLPILQILNISNNYIDINSIQWVEKLIFKKLRKFESNNIKLESNKSFLFNKMQNLQYIDISNNIIQCLDTFEHKKLRELKLIGLEINNITNTFTDKLIFLTSLELQNNKIKQFPQLELDNLIELNLSINQINIITNIQICYLPRLEILHLENNLLENIQSMSKINNNLQQLKQLYLEMNQINILPCLYFPKLILLNLNKNQLQNVSALTISKIPEIQQIFLKENQIQQIPLLNCKKLRIFQPNQNKITQLKQFSLSELPALRKIVFWGNKIKQLTILNFSKAQHLYMYSNDLTNISKLTQCNLLEVRSISLFNNKITHLPILQLMKLEKIYLYRNQICDISCIEKWNTPLLRLIDLNTNVITKLPHFNQQSLMQLQLSNNKINDITEFIDSQLPQLRKLYLSNNEIVKLGILKLPKLEQLYMRNNKIESLEQISLSLMKNIKKMGFNNNLITFLPNFNFPSLDQLSLRKNEITKFEGNFSHQMKKMTKIFLTDNKIQKFITNNLDSCQYLQQLSLTRNPLKQIILKQNLNLIKLFLIQCNLYNANFLFLPQVKQIYLQKNYLNDLKFLTQPGAFLSLKIINLGHNLFNLIINFDLPVLEIIHIYDNPILNFDNFLQSNLPKLKKIFLTKTNIKKSVKQIQINLPAIESQKQQNDSDSDKQDTTSKLKKKMSLPQSEINQSTFQKKIKQKFPKIQVYF